MFHRYRCLRIVGPTVLLTAASGLAGCASLGAQFAQKPASNPVPETHPETDQLADAGKSQAILTAVEEFLDRTEKYQSSEAAGLDVRTARDSTALPDSIADRHRPEPGPSYPLPQSTPGLSQTDLAAANAQMELAATPASEPTRPLPVIRRVSVRAPALTGVPAAEADDPKTTNQAVGLITDETSPTVSKFIQQLEVQTTQAKDLDSEWQLRLTQLAHRRDTDAVDISPELSMDTRAILAGLIRLGTELRRLLGDPLATGEEALNRVDELRRHLADRADPIVSSIALCRKVATYGVYDEMPDEDFVAGRTVQTIVYSEVRNLRSDIADNGQYRTLLRTRLEVLTADGKSVWEHEEPEVQDLCRRPRTDFFIAQRMSLPPTLAAGDYVLKVLVEDRLSGKANEATYPFAVISPTTVAAGR
ncbi:MAG: hypothetical protein KJ749_11395 [Planctomycetes bacterium]|nr:hypothetical protein [Planctomycetota bacterium]